MAQGKAALHEDPLRPFTVQRNGSPLLLTPVLASGADADAKLREVAISLFRHVLPGVGRRFMRKLLASERATTLLLMRSAEDVLAERRRHLAALQAAPAASSDKEDEEGSEKTSSFSGPSGSGSGSGEDEAGGADGSAGGRSPPAGGEVSSCSEGDDEALRGAPAEAAAVRLKHRVVGAASWEMVPEPQCPRGSERVLQLTLIGVRTKFQSCGLGAQLIRRALSPRLSGLHDATIAFADHDAVPFFRRHGFSDDAILTSRFRAVADAWDQSVLMLRADLRAPPRGVSGGGADDPLLQSPSDLAEPRYLAGDDLRASVDEWRALKVETYSSELALVERLRAEVVLLRARAVKQDDYVRFLKAENTQLHRQRGALAEDVAGLRAELAARDPRAQPPRPQPQQPREGAQPPSGADASTSAGASAESSRRGLSSTLAPLDAQAAESCRVAAAFAASLRPGEHACGSLSVVRVWQLASDQRRNARRLGFEAAVRAAAGAQAAAADQPLELYLGAPVEVLQHVLVNGFDMELWPPRNEALRHLDVFGDGMYLSRDASKAHHFSGGCGFVLLVAAHLTDSHMVVLPDASRAAPDGTSTAIIVPGRQLPGRATGKAAACLEKGLQARLAARDACPLGEEYVVFRQRLPPVMPLYLVEYAAD